MKLKLKPWINDLPVYVAGRTIEEIKKKYGLKEVYKMASNENILGPCDEVRQYLSENLDDINYYPDSDAYEIRYMIARKYGLLAENIIMGNGTDQIIEMISDCFIDRGDNIVTADPNFIIYEKAALKCGGGVIKVPLAKDTFRQDPKAIVSSVDKNTKIVFLANPHNPTGTTIEEKELSFMLQNIPDDIIVVLDEAYYEYLSEGCKIDTVSFLKNNPNLVLLRTFSKIYGLAGLRIGYGIAGTEVISALNKIRMPFNTSLIAQRAAVKAIENDWYAEEIRWGVESQKEIFYKVFEKEGVEYIKSEANFILLNAGKHSGEIIEKLLKAGFIVRPGENLGFAGYIRVTISRSEINKKFLDKFVNIFKQFYGKNSKK
ncbi:MAG: histidinol-phosphate transaminase [Actinobacteria bacterium]|nr:histidinol-phosphate transaminase [Actinomycetota bacterium]